MAFGAKLRKLRRDPRAFVRDSKVASLARERLEARAGKLEPGAGSFLPTRQRDFARDDLKTRLAHSTPGFFVDDEFRCVFCVLQSDQLRAAESIVELLGSGEFSLLYQVGSEWRRAHTAREVLDFLTASTAVSFLLEDQRSIAEFAVELQAWAEHPDYIHAPCANPISRRVWRQALEGREFFQPGRVVHLSTLFDHPNEETVQFPVDFVYTWVNSDDPDWQRLYREFRPDSNTDATSLSRFYNRDELRYSLRALAAFAPWARRVHVVSNCAPPPWLDLDNEKVHWVRHEDIFREEDLPTFSSHAIESRLHHIDGLSNHFVYSNDDFLLTRPTSPRDFFEPNGLCRLKLESWGNVNGEARAGDPDYLNAARNCQSLLARDFGAIATRLHSHAPQAIRVDILREMEQRYAEEFSATAGRRFRGVEDIAVTGFFFHHYAYLTGNALIDDAKTLLVQQNHNFKRLYRNLLDERSFDRREDRTLSVCINDGRDSHLNAEWNRATEAFLNEVFPYRSEFEK